MAPALTTRLVPSADMATLDTGVTWLLETCHPVHYSPPAHSAGANKPMTTAIMMVTKGNTIWQLLGNGLPVRPDAPASFRLIAVIRFNYIGTPAEWQ